MKNWKKITALFVAALALCLFISCSNGSDSGSSVPAVTTEGTNTGGGETNTTTPTPETTPTPAPGVTYTITFNANDGSVNPATATQSFTEGMPQALKTIAELGFSKNGFYFAGWSAAADATKSSYADGAEYTANANITFYAIWSAIPVYSVMISSEHGTVTPSQATGIEGTEIVLSNTPAIGWQFDSYTVMAGSTNVEVTNDKFTMPAQDVTVTANFTAIDYNVEIGSIANGSIVAKIGLSTVNTANYGQTITLTATAESDNYRIDTLSVTANDGTSVTLSGTGNTRTFAMPAQSVTVNATFESKHTITLPTSIDGGTVTADKTAAFAGETVMLTISSAFAYKLEALTVTNSDGTSEVLNEGDNGRTFTMPAKSVTVTAIFTEIPAVSGALTKIGTATINEKQYDLVTFGLWPQTIKGASVNIDEGQTKVAGAFTYCRGSDGQWYAKVKESAIMEGFEYTDGTAAGQSSSNSYKWFKVEPLKWRVLTTNYNGTGKKLLLAKDLLQKCAYYDYKKVNRVVDGNTIYSNNYEHSKIRAFLNGLSYPKKASDSTSQITCDDFLNRGFLQTAFTTAELATIADTSVDNSARSTIPDSYVSLIESKGYFYWIDENNQYASDTPTTDKIFLLSEQEVSKSEYGFAPCDPGVPDNIRSITQLTDYAKANGMSPYWSWWLRSPFCNDSTVCIVEGLSGFVYNVSFSVESSFGIGIVPALCVE